MAFGSPVCSSQLVSSEFSEDTQKLLSARQVLALQSGLQEKYPNACQRLASSDYEPLIYRLVDLPQWLVEFHCSDLRVLARFIEREPGIELFEATFIRGDLWRLRSRASARNESGPEGTVKTDPILRSLADLSSGSPPLDCPWRIDRRDPGPESTLPQVIIILGCRNHERYVARGRYSEQHDWLILDRIEVEPVPVE